MPELLLHNKPVGTVFDLLGDKEDDLTYSLGWALANSDALVGRLLAVAYGANAKAGEVLNLRLQQSVAGQGRTDVEIQTERLHLIVEAKAGWTLPTERQLRTYVPRFGRSREALLLSLSECSTEYAMTKLPSELDGVPVGHVSWPEVLATVEDVAASRPFGERRLLREFSRYLKGVITMQDVQSNLAYVLSLGQAPLGSSGINFVDVVVDHDRYFHPVGGGRGGWPRVPPNYLAFRFDSRLQQIRHVEHVEVFEPPDCPGLPQLRDNVDWTEGLHYLYHLGPAILPQRETPNGPGIARAVRTWAAIDLLLTAPSISDAARLTKERLAAAGQE